MAILFWTTKFTSANMFTMTIWDPTAKFDSHQYFRLYDTRRLETSEMGIEEWIFR